VSTALEAARRAERELREGQVFICFADGCGERFPDEASLRRHRARAHRTSKRRRR
jgi:hypothetical protein